MIRVSKSIVSSVTTTTTTTTTTWTRSSSFSSLSLSKQQKQRLFSPGIISSLPIKNNNNNDNNKRHSSYRYSSSYEEPMPLKEILNPLSSSSSSSLSALSIPQFYGSETLLHNNNNNKSSSSSWSPPLTKIVATIGPTSEQLPILEQVVQNGMRIMRLNFSHATKEEVELRLGNLKQCSIVSSKSESEKESEKESSYCIFSLDEDKTSTTTTNNNNNNQEQINVRATLLDTRGPEIRTGKLQNDISGHETITLLIGNTVTLHPTSTIDQTLSTINDLYIDYKSGLLSDCLKPGMKVLLDDGAITLTITEIINNTNNTENEEENNNNTKEAIICSIDNTGELRSRAGVNLPGAETSMPAMSEKDKQDIRYGMTWDVDYIAASFVQSAAGVREIRSFMYDVATNELQWDLNERPLPLIISKIESASALNQFDGILEESDGIMVARGDLGVEIPIQQVTNAQKEIVAACNAVGKPVIVATQMLESMAKNPRPTRAEVADVTNAVFDGADAVMLSGETAKGLYPVETVKMMNEIILGAERFSDVRPDLVGLGSQGSRLFFGSSGPGRFLGGGFGGVGVGSSVLPQRSANHAIAKAAVTAAEERKASAILVLTTMGNMPRLVSAYRPNVPIVAFCPCVRVARRLQIHRAIHPIYYFDKDDASSSSSSSSKIIHPVQKRAILAIRHARKIGFVKAGDDVVVVTTEDDENGENGEENEEEELLSLATMRIVTVPST